MTLKIVFTYIFIIFILYLIYKVYNKNIIEKFFYTNKNENNIRLKKTKEPHKCLFIDKNNVAGYNDCKKKVDNENYRIFKYNTKFDSIKNAFSNKYLKKTKNSIGWTRNIEDASPITFSSNNELIIKNNKTSKSYLCANPLIFANDCNKNGGTISKIL